MQWDCKAEFHYHITMEGPLYTRAEIIATHNPITFTEKQRAGIGLLESQGWVALKDGELRCPAFATLSCEAALEATSIRPNCSLFEYLLPRKCGNARIRKFVILRPKTRWNERWESLREVVRGSKKTEEKVERSEGVTALRAHWTPDILQKIMSAIERILVNDLTMIRPNVGNCNNSLLVRVHGQGKGQNQPVEETAKTNDTRESKKRTPPPVEGGPGEPRLKYGLEKE
ncbi:hypothetical protein EV361DRAFT_873957 [Lentinula raphanica]|nr:hypothetical protein EV361DRAFT_873957 [Lentinula raphanica]